MKTILVDARKVLVTEEGLYQPLYDLLESYPNPKITLTNANTKEQEKLGLNKQPYPLFTLTHNPEKAESLYYEMMLNHFNLTPTEVIYFESNPQAVESARLIGIITHYFDRQLKDIESLKILLDKNL
ncbi:MAG: hypothetical protein LBI53_04610 [Candidatus Peribacteria bacterium]|jgi:FMN phosphatase YigB (HAD superfamily)|nr:hypothetical protein [Candidatus Peribacteria bacterium]